MANGLLYTDVSSAIRQQFPQVMVDAVGRKSKMLGLFPHRTVDGGPGPRWWVTYSGNSSVTSYADGASEPVAGKQAKVQASLDWKYSWGTVRVSRRVIDTAGPNWSYISGEVQNELNGVRKDLVQDLVTQLQGDGSTATDIDGIQTAISASATYANILRSSYTWWQSYVESTIGSLAVADLKTISRTLRSGVRMSEWDYAICGPTVWNIYGDLVEDTSTRTVGQADMAGAGLTYDGGYRALLFEGRPVIEIPGYTAQRIDFIRQSDFHLDFVRQFTVDEPERDSDDIIWLVTVALELVCEHSGAQGTGTGITG